MYVIPTEEYGIAFDAAMNCNAVPERKVSLPHVWGDEPTTASIPTELPRLREKKVVLSETFPLQELGEKYSKSLPLQIKVQRGYSGQTANITISTADIFNVHCVKRQKVIRIKDNQGSVYSIPLNSSIKIGLVYEPSGGDTKAGESFIFPRVSDLLSVSTLPKVVCATKACKGADVKTTVQKNEILIVRQAHRPKLLGKKYIEAFSLVSRIEKYLDADCEGHFSTQPMLVGLHIPELLEFLPTAFPCQAFLLAGATLESSLRYISNSTISTPVTILEATAETSLIVSPVLDPEVVPPESMESEETLLDIPLDDCLADVEVAIVEMEKSEIEELRDETKKVLDCLDVSKFKSYKDTGSDRSYEVQSLFYTSVRDGDETIGIELDAPTLPCASDVKKREEMTHTQEQDDLEKDTVDEYVQIMSPQKVYTESKEEVKAQPELSSMTTSKTTPADTRHDRREKMPTPPPSSSPDLISDTREYEIVRGRGYSHHTALDQTEQTDVNKRNHVLSEITEIKSALLQLGKRCELLEGMIKDLPQLSAAPMAAKQETSEAQTKNNRLYLCSLDISQVSNSVVCLPTFTYLTFPVKVFCIFEVEGDIVIST